MAKTTESLIIKKIERLPGIETCRCNICGRLIYRRSLQKSDELPKNNELYSFWEVMTGHNDWGNDSGDSIEHYEVCSTTCLQRLFDIYKIESSEDQRNSQYIEIKHHHIYGYEHEGDNK